MIYNLAGFPHRIVVEGNQLKFEYYPFLTMSPAREWLIENVGERGEGWDYSYDGHYLEVFFKDLSVATLFKLRWT